MISPPNPLIPHHRPGGGGTLYTIGHSTRSLDDFIALLQAHGIKALADIRAFPMSRRLPHFNRELLAAALAANAIEYHWIAALGGRRKRSLPPDQSPNRALRSDSFRNYADYMLTPGFRAAIDELLAIAVRLPTAYMCAEAVYFRCHRMLVSDYLVAHGCHVLHIQDLKPPRPHKLTNVARLCDGVLHYDLGELF